MERAGQIKITEREKYAKGVGTARLCPGPGEVLAAIALALREGVEPVIGEVEVVVSTALATVGDGNVDGVTLVCSSDEER